MDARRECEHGCLLADDHEVDCLTQDDINEAKLRARDYDAWAAL
jgi:hypothetical protein